MDLVSRDVCAFFWWERSVVYGGCCSGRGSVLFLRGRLLCTLFVGPVFSGGFSCGALFVRSWLFYGSFSVRRWVMPRRVCEEGVLMWGVFRAELWFWVLGAVMFRRVLGSRV